MIAQTDTTSEEDLAECYINFIIDHTIPESITQKDIQEATVRDPILTKVRQLLQTKWEMG